MIASARDGRCVIEVLDTGNRDNAPRHIPDQATLMSEHGRGLKIIDAVVDDLYLTGNGAAGTPTPLTRWGAVGAVCCGRIAVVELPGPRGSRSSVIATVRA